MLKTYLINTLTLHDYCIVYNGSKWGIYMKSIHKEIVNLFLKLGFFAYGGPAAHTAMMNEEVVQKRKWLSESEFLDLIGFTNLIPGPNSTELAILVGYKMGGALGLLLAGISFIFPAVLIVMIFTYFYVQYSSIIQVQSALSGMSAIMVAIIISALSKMMKSNVKDSKSVGLLIFSLLLLFLNFSEITVLLVSGLVALILYTYKKSRVYSIEPISLSILFYTFVKIGSLLYGSGYVLIAFLRSEFVTKLQYLTENQLLDLVLIGEITPGPVFTSATAIGFYLSGIKGAIVSTVGIFIPSFLLIFILYPIYNKLRDNLVIKNFLNGVSIASLSIMLKVCIDLSLNISNSLLLVIMCITSFILLYKYKVNNIILIIISALIGTILL